MGWKPSDKHGRTAFVTGDGRARIELMGHGVWAAYVNNQLVEGGLTKREAKRMAITELQFQSGRRCF